MAGRRTRVATVVVLVAAVVVIAANIGLALGRHHGSDAPSTASAGRSSAHRTHHTGGSGADTTTKLAASAHADSAAVASATTPATDPRNPSSWTRTGAAARRTPVPILMYHLVAAAPAGTAYPGLWVPPTLLREQVAALRKAGFVGVTLGEAWDAWHGDGRLPAHPVVLSFDDGDISQALGAGPVLKAAGWPGVLNLATGHLGPGGLPMWGARRLIEQGWEIDSHTIDHLDVTTLDATALRHQLVGSKARIKHQLGVDARFFCYPAGRNDATAQAAVKAAGYVAATTVEPGIATSSDAPFTLPRIRVEPTTTPT
ncbi:MAG: polysaccharide deacetylase family protein, partial [Patulibacter sp.]|nr:polysaccharide deacetylase family protein [Patulibacter sp.]